MLKKFDELSKKIISESFGHPYVMSIGHVDIFRTEEFNKDVGKSIFLTESFINILLNKIDLKSITNETEFMIYERPFFKTVILKIIPFGSFRHRIVLERHFYNVKSIPHLTKTGQIRIIFEEEDYK